MHVYIIMLIFGNPVGGTHTLKYGGSVTRFFLRFSSNLLDLLVRLQFPLGPFASSVCS